MYRSILVPLDGSAFGEHALPFALNLARRTGAQLHLAHIHMLPVPILADANDAEQRASERMYFEGLVQRIAARWDVPITTMLLDGPVVPTLDQYVVTSEADLIVMTTHGRGALSRFWLGSIADTMIRQVSVPILLVRPHEQMLDIAHEPAIKHILIPLDGSVLAERVLSHATTLGRLVQAEYTLFQAIDPMYLGYGTELYAFAADEQIMEQLHTRARAYLDRLAAPLRADGLQVQIATTAAPVAEAILDYAHTHAVDMIAVTTHGRTGLARWLVGGVADKVIRGATVPVLVHRPQDGAERTR